MPLPVLKTGGLRARGEEPGYHQTGRVGMGMTGQGLPLLTGVLVGMNAEGRDEKPVVI